MARNISWRANTIKEDEVFCAAFIPATLLGDVNIAVTRRGLISIDFDQPQSEFIKQTSVGKNIKYTNSDLDLSNLVEEAIAQISSYLFKNSDAIRLPIDLRRVKKFQRAVLENVMNIQRGHIVTYGDVAKMKIGRAHV